MSEPYIGQVILFAGNYVPEHWLLCNGQVVNIANFQALFNVIGKRYGGDGTTTFAVPNLCGRMVLGFTPEGQKPADSLTPREMGESGGFESIILTKDEMPSHTHTVMAIPEATDPIPTPATIWGGSASGGVTLFSNTTPPDCALSPDAISTTGASSAHNNMPPFVAMNYLICASGVVPVKG